MAKSRGTNVLVVGAGLIGLGLLAERKKSAVSGIGSIHKNYHIIKAKYIGPTDIKGSRVKIESERFRENKVIRYDSNFNSTVDIAVNWLEKNGFQIIGTAEGKDHDYIITSTFKSLKEK